MWHGVWKWWKLGVQNSTQNFEVKKLSILWFTLFLVFFYSVLSKLLFLFPFCLTSGLLKYCPPTKLLYNFILFLLMFFWLGFLSFEVLGANLSLVITTIMIIMSFSVQNILGICQSQKVLSLARKCHLRKLFKAKIYQMVRTIWKSRGQWDF